MPTSAFHEMRDALRAHFDKWLATGYPLRSEPFEGDGPLLVSAVDEEGLAEWRPIFKDAPTLTAEIEALEQRHGVRLHESVRAYFDCAWFLDLEGQCAGRGVTLDFVRPGQELEALETALPVWRGPRHTTPVGLEAKEGLLVVVDNATGEVLIWDHDRDELAHLADDLPSMIRGFLSS
jgi:hypothetical protein